MPFTATTSGIKSSPFNFQAAPQASASSAAGDTPARQGVDAPMTFPFLGPLLQGKFAGKVNVMGASTAWPAGVSPAALLALAWGAAWKLKGLLLMPLVVAVNATPAALLCEGPNLAAKTCGKGTSCSSTFLLN